MPAKTPITVAHGDGIGPEIMEATLRILDAAGAQLDIETIEIGEKVYLDGNSSGIEASAWDSLLRTKVFLKAPITTPQGGGMKSLNVTVRKTLGLYANVRPCVSYDPFVQTRHPNMNLVIVRENEEDLYAGIEHQQTLDTTQCLKIISRPGCERIVRYAFEYALRNNRRKVTCITKDNIMKITDGLFHRVFQEIAKEYPEIHSDHLIVDIGAARIADTPEMFDVIVTLNLYGDIISDVAAQVAGSVGLAGSSNVGAQCAMFEAIHGSAPLIAGQNIANPSGLLNGAIMMLVHINQPEVATRIHNAWLRTLEDGLHTKDIFNAHSSKHLAGTDEFANGVIARLGHLPTRIHAVEYNPVEVTADRKSAVKHHVAKKEIVGVDVFLTGENLQPEAVGSAIKELAGVHMDLVILSNRGVKVWPSNASSVGGNTYLGDHWCCRFMAKAPATRVEFERDIVPVMSRIAEAGYDVIKMETLCTFDGKPGYSLGQGQ